MCCAYVVRGHYVACLGLFHVVSLGPTTWSVTFSSVGRAQCGLCTVDSDTIKYPAKPFCWLSAWGINLSL